VKYQIVNSGKVSTLLDSVYFGLWADTDIGDPTDEYAGSDTLVQSGYVYNDSSDADFGLTPPAHFMTLLQGPIVYIPGQTFTDNNSNNTYEEGIDNPLDSAFQQNFTERKMVRGAKNLGISSFIHYQSSDPFIGDPNTNLEAYNYLRGRIRTGEFINPCNWNLGKVVGDNCLEVNPVFYYSGDPVTDWGWINIKKNDQRQLTSVGPFKLEADKPVDIIVGSIIAKGSSNLNSISLGKEYASNLIRVAKSNLNILITGSANDYKTNPSEFLLSQNYPNPFNPSTKINYSLPYTANVKLQVYDVLGNLITTIVNEEQNAGSYNVDLDLSKFSSGVYFYQLQTGNFIQTKKMLLMK
ncbi:MAG: T9SS type A sorting domain-containing protein, partial [Syntrophothermus sp.]